MGMIGGVCYSAMIRLAKLMQSLTPFPQTNVIYGALWLRFYNQNQASRSPFTQTPSRQASADPHRCVNFTPFTEEPASWRIEKDTGRLESKSGKIER